MSMRHQRQEILLVVYVVRKVVYLYTAVSHAARVAL